MTVILWNDILATVILVNESEDLCHYKQLSPDYNICGQEPKLKVEYGKELPFWRFRQFRLMFLVTITIEKWFNVEVSV